MNTNGKLADIWLIYRCVECAATHNVSVVERTPVTRIGRNLFEAATVNDPVVARRLARDASIVRAAGARFASGDDIRVDVTGVEDPCFRLAFADPLVVRLDQVLSLVTPLSRSRLRALEQSQHLILEPRRPLSRVGLTADTTVRLRTF